MKTSFSSLIRKALALLLLFGYQAAMPATTPAAERIPTPAHPSAVIDIYPGESFETAAESLTPGDTLIVHAGTYPDTGRISITVQGSALAPVMITSAAGEASPLIMRPASAAPQNTINIEGATYLTIRGLEITSNGGDGVKMTEDSAYITLEELHIHAVDVGINFKDNLHHITVRRNHIHDTGTGNTTGEGMYVGCHDGTCSTHDSLIEGNWIHDTLAASQGDGIEIKKGSFANVIRDNVIYNTRYPCILLYGTEGNPRNIVERNVMWNCGDSGIQVAADALLENNIILNNPQYGLNSQDHNGVTPANLAVIHNTIVGGSTCLRMNNWANKPGMIFSNNAVFCEGGSYAISDLSGVEIRGNVIYPTTAQLPAAGYIPGRSTALDFLEAANMVVYPSTDSALIDAGDPSYSTAVDFDTTVRTGLPDAGAYAWTGPAHPGWSIQEGFKALFPLAGLSLGMEGEPNPATTSQPLTLTLTVQNQNPFTATGVVLTDTLPVSATLTTFLTTHGDCSPGPGSLICLLGEISPLETALIQIIVTQDAEGVAVNLATVAGDDADPDPENNTVSLMIMFFSGDPFRQYLPLAYRSAR
jgi:uncharacterized repeat protein (TIGR01451 family)